MVLKNRLIVLGSFVAGAGVMVSACSDAIEPDGVTELGALSEYVDAKADIAQLSIPLELDPNDVNKFSIFADDAFSVEVERPNEPFGATVRLQLTRESITLREASGHEPKIQYTPPIRQTEKYLIRVDNLSSTKTVSGVLNILDDSDEQTPQDGDLRAGPDGDSPAGLLEVFHDGTWRGVCDDFFGLSEARVACSQLGFDPVFAQFSTATGVSSDFWLDNVDCSGSESRLVDCAHRPFGEEDCSKTEHVKLTCSF